MTFLGIIEERVNLILMHYYRVMQDVRNIHFKNSNSKQKDLQEQLNQDKYTQLANQAKVPKDNGELPDIFGKIFFAETYILGEEFEDEENEGEKILSEEEFKNLAIAKIE